MAGSVRAELILDLVEQARATARGEADAANASMVESAQWRGALHGSAIQQALYGNDLKAVEKAFHERLRAESDEPLAADDAAKDAWVTQAEADLRLLLDGECAWLEERGRDRESRHGQRGNFDEWVKPLLERDRTRLQESAAREIRILRGRRALSKGNIEVSEPAGKRDAVIGVWDRETFNSDVTAYAEKALRDSRPLGLLMVDVDRFKRINDTHGHPKGDAVLAGAAARLEAVADGKGRVYRYGGEEIVVVLPNHGVQEATAVAERMRVELEQQQIEGLSVTASFGVSVCPDHGSTAPDLVKAADGAMYDAKNRGRNLVRVSGEPAPAKPGPREIERKAPQSGALTENEKKNLRVQHFSGHLIRCPQDGAIFKTEQLDLMGHDTPIVVIRCPLCGMSDEI